jgi:hypothetical protein
MFSSSDGVAVALTPSRVLQRGCCVGASTPHRDFLAATSDGGRTWRATGELPAAVDPPASFDLSLAFSTPREGYVQTAVPEATVFTDDGGRTWSRLTPPGQPTAISLAGQALWIISHMCPTASSPPGLCPSELLTYRLGQSVPFARRPIPTVGVAPSPGLSGSARAATLLDRLGPGSAVIEEGSEGAPTSLLVTDDSGGRWTALVDPCEGLVPTGLVAPSPTTWMLYCQLDGGMNQGTTGVYASIDRGHTWTQVAGADEQGDTRGTIGDAMAGDFTISGNGRILWLLGSVGGVETSTDGGRDWRTTDIQTGGASVTLATAGSTRAWLPLAGKGLYVTSNGSTWSRLT